MRKKIVAGNWKCNLGFAEAEELIDAITKLWNPTENESEMIICPPAIYLEMALDLTQNTGIAVGAQNCSPFDNGAYTGEISAAMLHPMGVSHCIIGHSERRKYFNEDNVMLLEKTKKLLKYQIKPIFCCGETLEQRNASEHKKVVESQLQETIFQLPEKDFCQVIIAYEPVWAIGTGVNATSEQAQEMHAFIRSLIFQKYGEEIAYDTVILYGGSCNAANAKDLFACEDVDGGLIGGASLKSNEFIQIAKSF